MLGLAVVLLASGLGIPVGGAAGGPGRSDGSITGTLSIGPFVAHPYEGFWSVVIPGTFRLNSSLAALFNATPFVLIRYGAEIDASNVSNGCTYSNDGVCGSLNESIPDFATFCGWVHCLSVLGVPGEPNDAGLAALTVRYVERTIGFDPTFWSIGNEPEAWTHFGEPFADWRTSDHATPNGSQYGEMVANVSRAIDSVDPNARIIGDQDAQSGHVLQYLRNVSRQSAASVSAVAFHSYPGANGPAHPTVASFLSPGNVGRTAGYLATDRSDYDSACGCFAPIMVGEFNGALGSGSYAPELQGYADVPMVAATAAQMLTDNASIFSFFAFSGDQPFDLVSSENGTTSPTYALYADLLRELPMGTTEAASVTTSLPGVFAVQESDNLSQSGLLVVNTNTTTDLTLSIGSWFGNESGEILLDTPALGVETSVVSSGSAPTNVTVPAEGVALMLKGPTTLPPKGNGSGGSIGTNPPGGTSPTPSKGGGGSTNPGGLPAGAVDYLVPALAAGAAAVAVLAYVVFGRRGRRGRSGL